LELIPAVIGMTEIMIKPCSISTLYYGLANDKKYAFGTLQRTHTHGIATLLEKSVTQNPMDIAHWVF
jgi:hypothetical protein